MRHYTHDDYMVILGAIRREATLTSVAAAFAEHGLLWPKKYNEDDSDYAQSIERDIQWAMAQKRREQHREE